MSEIPDHLQLFDLIRRMLDYDPATRITLGKPKFTRLSKTSNMNLLFTLSLFQIKPSAIHFSQSFHLSCAFTKEVMTVQVVLIAKACRDENYLDLNIIEKHFFTVAVREKDGKMFKSNLISPIIRKTKFNLSH